MKISIKQYRLLIIESFLIAALCLGWYISRQSFHLNLTLEHLVDIILLVELMVLFLVRDSHPRLFYFAFLFLVFSMITSAFEFGTLMDFFSSLTVSFLALGLLNLILFSKTGR